MKAEQEKDLREKLRTSFDSWGCLVYHKVNNEVHCIVSNSPFVKKYPSTERMFGTFFIKIE